MRSLIVTVLILSLSGPLLAQSRPASRPAESRESRIRPLALGSDAPEFDLPGVDGKNHRLADFAKARILLVLFTCNHCPTAQAYEERINKLHEDYAPYWVGYFNFQVFLFDVFLLYLLACLIIFVSYHLYKKKEVTP
jgi:hypothetical protein